MNYQTLLDELTTKNTTLVAVSKTKSKNQILELYNKGQRIFGENRVQELVDKYDHMPKDIEWHMIGHLQKNKVKYIITFISLIHSVDSLVLLERINKEAKKAERVVDILLQQKIAMEDSKYGMSQDEIIEIVSLHSEGQFANIRINGLMGMASFVSDQDTIKLEFDNLKKTFDYIIGTFGTTLTQFNILSMGMSGDYKLAINCGSNMVRIGSLLFGPRS